VNTLLKGIQNQISTPSYKFKYPTINAQRTSNGLFLADGTQSSFSLFMRGIGDTKNQYFGSVVDVQNVSVSPQAPPAYFSPPPPTKPPPPPQVSWLYTVMFTMSVTFDFTGALSGDDVIPTSLVTGIGDALQEAYPTLIPNVVFQVQPVQTLSTSTSAVVVGFALMLSSQDDATTIVTSWAAQQQELQDDFYNQIPYFSNYAVGGTNANWAPTWVLQQSTEFGGATTSITFQLSSGSTPFPADPNLPFHSAALHTAIQYCGGIQTNYTVSMTQGRHGWRALSNGDDVGCRRSVWH
jgi:hypothetical protein